MVDVAVAWDTDWVFPDGTSAVRGFASGQPTVLLVTEDGSLSVGNAKLRDLLVDNNYEVVVRSWAAPEDYLGIDVVVVSRGNPPGDTGKYVSPPVGIVGVDTWIPLGMGTTLGFENNVNSVEVVDAASPLAGGVPLGTFAPYLAPAYITWETNLATSPDVIVSRPSTPGQAVLFGFEAGSTMPTRFATTRHVALGYHQDGLANGLSNDGERQLLAAVSWALDTTVVGLAAPAAPAGVSASAGDLRVTVSWSASAGATSYTVKRAEVTGGPYTDVQTVTGTSWADSTVTNGTEYFYVVSASNSVGESANSTQVSATPAESNVTNLSLLVTDVERSMWQTRKVSGPFKSFGADATNSPGHWDEMVQDAARDWTAGRWAGPQHLNGNGSVMTGAQLYEADISFVANDPPATTQRMSHYMMGAAYVAVTNNDAALAQSIVDEIRWYTGQSRLNYSNKTLYPDNHFQDLNPLFMHALWVFPFVIAYDACRVLVDADTTVENWLSGLAGACYGNTLWLNAQFPNRQSGDYTSRSSIVDNNIHPFTRLSNSNLVYHLQTTQWYSNRRSDMHSLIGMVGLLTNNSTYIDWAKLYMREFVMFGARTTANQWTFGDADRGSNSHPQQCFLYDITAFGRLIAFVDALARTGDTSLYDFSSSEGSAHPDWGSDHAKTMKQVIAQRIGIIDGTISAQYTGSGSPPSSSVAGNEFYRIKSRSQDSNREISADGWLLCAAAYYNEPTWQDAILRQETPTGFTNPPRSSGTIYGWIIDHRTRFLRSLDANPHGGA